jgi:membrane fusion protein (multidrug efflux system)
MPLPRPAKFVIVVVLAACAGTSYYLYSRNAANSSTQTTTDAYVATDSTFVAPKIAGLISQVFVEDNQLVKKGQLLATIDDRDFVVAVASAQADVEKAQADVATLQARLLQQQSVIQQANAAIVGDTASVEFARENARRYASLSTDGSGTVQEQQQASSQWQIAAARRLQSSAGRDAASHEVTVLQAQEKQAEANLDKAKSLLDSANLNVSYTHITAPIDGTVGQRTLRVGAYIHVGTPLLAVVPLQKAYIEANYRETQLQYVQAGQPVTIRVDMLAGRTLKGHVDSIAPATGVAFSAIEPDNATGNFTKVVQRLPVKISVDPGQDEAKVLRVGMSVVPTIEVRTMH